ncbi:MAG: hypothetical protein LBK62_09885 [Treponema sp.]|jgi:hypothetical protein|nr:hypothetical protein [Treponema sp.]
MAGIVPKEALAYLKNKNLHPAFSYKDVWHEEHAAAFTVAKAMQLDVLSDLHTAVVDAMEQGQSFESFKKNIKPLLQQKGWWGKKEMTDPLTGQTVSAQLGSGRRLKTIYQVNMRSAYQKGQYDRTMASDLHPYLMYRIGNSVHHREEHVSWDGLILPKDDPWWDSHFPPNGWGCKCYTRAVSEARKKLYEANGIPAAPRLDGTGGGTIPAKTQAPPVKYKTYFNERKGTFERVPEGVNPAFNWNQGKASRTEAAEWKMEQSKRDYEASAARAEQYLFQNLLPEAEDPEIIKKFLDKAEVMETDLRGLEAETKEEVLAGLNTAFSRLPGTKGAVPAIRADYTMSLDDYAFTSPLDGAITLNGGLFKNIAKLKEVYANDVRFLEHPRGTDYRSIVTHEAGHSIMLKLGLKLGLPVKTLCDRIQEDTLDYFNLTHDQITRELSRYAGKGSFDFVAEGLAEFLDSKAPRRAARKIGEIVSAYARELQK